MIYATRGYFSAKLGNLATYGFRFEGRIRDGLKAHPDLQQELLQLCRFKLEVESDEVN